MKSYGCFQKNGGYPHFTPQWLIIFSRKTHGCWGNPPFSRWTTSQLGHCCAPRPKVQSARSKVALVTWSVGKRKVNIFEKENDLPKVLTSKSLSRGVSLYPKTCVFWAHQLVPLCVHRLWECISSWVGVLAPGAKNTFQSPLEKIYCKQLCCIDISKS